MASVFLSYDHEDVTRAAPIASALEKAGHSVWWDRQIHGGAEYQTEIESAVQDADVVVVLWSGRSIKSAWVRDEAAEGRDRGKLVPVLLESVRPPMGFRQYQTIDLSNRRRSSGAAQLDEVLRAVTKMSSAAPSTRLSPSPAVSKRDFDRRTLLAGGAVATVAVAGLGAWALLEPEWAGASDSIAVLPFANLSGDPAQAYFVEGIAGEIRNTLTRIDGLKVAGSTSSAAVRQDDAQTAARKLGVANILTGNVRQTPATVRVNAELIEGRTGLAKWSQNYDRPPGDVIRIQTDIAENVARALAIALGARAKRALAAGETSNVAAQTLVFQARDVSWQLTVPALQQSLKLLDQAISLDPNYARAYAIKSFVANNLASAARTPADLARDRAQALQYARTALSIAPDLPIARSAVAFAYQLNLRLSEALHEHKIALSLGGGDPDVMRNYGWTRSGIFGKGDGLRLVDEALALDPLNWASHWAHVDVLFDARRYVEAVSYSLKLKQETPQLFKFPELLGDSLLMLGRTKEAALAFREIQDTTARIRNEALLDAKAGNRELAYTKVAALRQRDGEMESYGYARIYAQTGDKNRAFAALDRAWEIRLAGLAGLKIDPFIDPLRSDPRYAVLVKRLGFPA